MKLLHYIVYLDHWLGSLLLPLVALVVLVVCARRTRRQYWLKGAAIGAASHTVVFAAFIAFDLMLWKGPDSWVPISPTEEFQAMSSWPIQAFLLLQKGSDHFIEMRFLNYTAFSSWTIVGAIIGLIFQILRRKPNQAPELTSGIVPPGAAAPGAPIPPVAHR